MPLIKIEFYSLVSQTNIYKHANSINIVMQYRWGTQANKSGNKRRHNDHSGDYHGKNKVPRPRKFKLSVGYTSIQIAVYFVCLLNKTFSVH